MPGAARVGDVDTDSDTQVTGSPNVLTNNRRSVRITDTDDAGDAMVTGSPDVFVNGRSFCRLGDLDNDPIGRDSISTASSNVIVN